MVANGLRYIARGKRKSNKEAQDINLIVWCALNCDQQASSLTRSSAHAHIHSHTHTIASTIQKNQHFRRALSSATCLIYILCAELNAMREREKEARPMLWHAPRILLQKLNLIEIYDNGS